MSKDGASPGPCIIVVGEPGGELVQTVMRWAREREIDTVPCENVYAAVVAVAQAAGRRLLVIGRMEGLAAHNGAFWGISTAHATGCCCLLDPGQTPEPRDLLAAVRANVTMVGAVAEVQAILENWLAAVESQGVSRRGQGAAPAKRSVREETYEDLRATEAELSALLR